jgi:hypothetical protein
MIKISGRHKSIPSEVKRSLTNCLPKGTKVVMTDICSCRHKFRPGLLKVISISGLGVKIRAYFGSGIVNIFLKFENADLLDGAVYKINSL